MVSPPPTTTGSAAAPRNEEEERSICFSSESNHVESIFQNEETPMSFQKKKQLRRSRRRTLAPLFDNRINCSSTQKCVNPYDNSNYVYSDSISLRKRCWKSEDVLMDENEKSDSSSNTHLLSQGLEQTKQLDKQNQSSDCMTTPPRQKRIKKTQRRRSLAIQDGRLLLRDTSSSVSSSSMTFSPQPWSSLSSDNYASSQSKEGSDPEKILLLSSLSDNDDHGDNVTIKSVDHSSSLEKSRLSAPLPIRRSARIRKSMATKNRSLLNDADGIHVETCGENIQSVRFRLSTLSPIEKKNSANLTPFVEKHSSVPNGILEESSQNYGETETHGLNQLHEKECLSQKASNQSMETFGSVMFRLSTLSPVPIKSKMCEVENQNLDQVLDDQTTWCSSSQKGRSICCNDVGGCETSHGHELTEAPDQTCSVNRLAFKLSCLSPIGNNSYEYDTNSSSVGHEIITMPLDNAEENIDNVQEKHSKGKGETVPDNVFAKKPKQRRRSSLGLHVGGMISLKDLEAIHNEVVARKKLPEVLADQKKLNEPLEGISVKSKLENMSIVKHGKPSKDVDPGKNKMSNGLECESPHCRHPESITVQQIKEEMLRIFPGLDLQSTPCVSSRVFGCLVCLRRAGQNPESLKPLYPLLRSFVEAELAALADLTVDNEAARKKIHFCSYDFSSLITPVDTSTESSSIIEGCIWKLQTVLKEIENMSLNGQRTNNLALMKDLIKNIDEVENETGYFYLVECSKAMPWHWPPSRIKRAFQKYRQEFTYIISKLEISAVEPPVSFVRKTLGDFIGRIIRFHLRRLFNPVPLPLYSDGDDIPDYSHTRSRVHKLVEMVDEGGRDTATADGSISSVIGTALNRIIEFFELNKELLEREGRHYDDGYSYSFCKRPATVGGLVGNGCVIVLSEEDTSEIMLDIREGHTILAGVRACRFIKGLLTWPGVPEAISEAGGWIKIEVFSKMFLQYRLDEEMPEECHFTLLADVTSLLNKIRDEENQLLSIEQQCEDNLRMLWKRFRCGTRNKELLKVNPCIKLFQQELMGVGHRTKLPSLAKATLMD